MMIGHPHRSLFRNDRDDDALTVQASDARSHLGQLLLEADWSEASAHLTTPEGRRDVDARNDPLGLLTGGKTDLPRGKNAAFFAALFVRAPFELIDQICAAAPSHVDHPDDLMYVLSVVPTEEDARLEEASRRVPHRTRAWTPEEYDRLLDLLLRSFVSSGTPPSALLGHLPPWTIGASRRHALTPLGVAAYNPDVPAQFVRRIGALETGATEGACALAGRPTIPLMLAAASPLPPETSSAYVESRSRKWEKVKLLTLSKARWDERRRETHGNEIEARPTVREVRAACEAASDRNEWELVREYLKRYYHRGAANDDDESSLEPCRARLERHDEEVRSSAERRRRSREKARARDEWLHRNLGPIKYHVDILLDLASAVVPRKKHGVEAGGGIVGPMS